MEAEVTAIAPVEPDWKDIEARYLDGEEVKGIAADYNITPNTISMRAWRYHWRDQQFKRLERERVEVEREVRGCLAVSVLKDARAFQRDDPPAVPSDRLTLAKARECLLNTAARLFNWDSDPLTKAKVAKCLDI